MATADISVVGIGISVVGIGISVVATADAMDSVVSDAVGPVVVVGADAVLICPTIDAVTVAVAVAVVGAVGVAGAVGIGEAVS